MLSPEFIDSDFDDSALRAVGYGEYAKKLGEAVTLTPGLRYDYDGFNGQSLWSPRVNANVTVDSATRLNFGAGVFYQAPRFLEIAADPANVDLGAERSMQILAGVNRFSRATCGSASRGTTSGSTISSSARTAPRTARPTPATASPPASTRWSQRPSRTSGTGR